jgi:hypothetical protein
MMPVDLHGMLSHYRNPLPLDCLGISRGRRPCPLSWQKGRYPEGAQSRSCSRLINEHLRWIEHLRYSSATHKRRRGRIQEGAQSGLRQFSQ